MSTNQSSIQQNIPTKQSTSSQTPSTTPSTTQIESKPKVKKNVTKNVIKNVTTSVRSIDEKEVVYNTNCPVNPVDALIKELTYMCKLCEDLNTTLQPDILDLFKHIQNKTRQIIVTPSSSSSSTYGSKSSTEKHTTSRLVLCLSLIHI